MVLPKRLDVVLAPSVDPPKVLVEGAEVAAAGADPKKPPPVLAAAGADPKMPPEVGALVVVVLPKREGPEGADVWAAGLLKLKGADVVGAVDVALPKRDGPEDVVVVGFKPPNRLG